MNYNLITIYLTNKCNLSCPNCFALVDKACAIKYISFDYLKTKMNDFDKFKEIHLSGGEAILHPDFQAICDMFKRNIVVVTNGIKTFAAPNISLHNSMKNGNYENHLPMHLEGKVNYATCSTLNACGTSMGVNGKYYFCALPSFIDIELNLGLGFDSIDDLFDKEKCKKQYLLCKYCI